MSSRRRGMLASLSWSIVRARVGALGLAMALVASTSHCGGDVVPPDPPPVTVASIIIDDGVRNVERGSEIVMTATARDASGKVVTVPFAWRSTADSIATFQRDGRLVARDTGQTTVTASALGIISASVGVRVVWLGAAKIATWQFNAPNAITPGIAFADSIRVAVTTLTGAPAQGSLVAFKVTEGGGSVARRVVAAGPSGIAAAKWTLGPVAGRNTVTATVVGADSTTPITWVQQNPAQFTVKTYAALAVVSGDGQTANVLSPVPLSPVIRLVDSAGKPRAGVPISFAPSNNGRVANVVASTSADGVASPGIWTLGDAAGDQQLVVTVENARLILHATATGSTVRFAATQVAATQAATCALTADQFVSCFGTSPQIGAGDTIQSRSLPTITKGSVHFTSLTGGGGSAHFCGTGVADLSIYCWGINALADTTGVVITNNAPARLQSNTAWLQVSPGGQHNCALASDRSAYCWGIDTSGQLGVDGLARRYAPQPVAGGFKFSSLAAGTSHQCGITLDAAAFCWGLNSNGQLGDGTTINRRTPTAVSSNLKWKAIGAGSDWTCALTDAGAVHCWGGRTGRPAPTVPYVTVPEFASITVGAAHACALTSDGKAYCWGDNSGGQLGDSTTTSREIPTLVTTELRFASISAGTQHTCAVTTDRFVACWGRNTVGEIGLAQPTLQLTPRFVILGVKP